MKALSVKNVIDMGVRPESFGLRNAYNPEIATVVDKLLKLKPGTYVFVTKEEWKGKTNLTQYLTMSRSHPSSRLYGKNIYAITVDEGWVVTRKLNNLKKQI